MPWSSKPSGSTGNIVTTVGLQVHSDTTKTFLTEKRTTRKLSITQKGLSTHFHGSSLVPWSSKTLGSIENITTTARSKVNSKSTNTFPMSTEKRTTKELSILQTGLLRHVVKLTLYLLAFVACITVNGHSYILNYSFIVK